MDVPNATLNQLARDRISHPAKMTENLAYFTILQSMYKTDRKISKAKETEKSKKINLSDTIFVRKFITFKILVNYII